MSINVESGLRNVRCEFIREVAGSYAITPADPDWELFSDEVFQANWAPNTDIFAKRALGDVDPGGFFPGPEAHQLTIEYYLQRWLKTGTSPLDPLGDAVDRDADNNLPSSLSLLTRESRSVSGGADNAGERVYTYGVGAYAGEITIPGQIDTGEPVRPVVVYTASKIRSYSFSQPSASTTLRVSSTSALDTTQTVTIESDGEPPTASEAIGTLTGVTPVVGVTSFASIDAISLDLETVGDVIIDDGTLELARIRGSAYYNGIAGDLGIPLLGTGSHGAVLALPYEIFINDTIERPAATSLATYINSAELRINNNLEVFPQLGTMAQIIVPGIRTSELSATVFGPSESHALIEQHLGVVGNNIVWTLTGGTIQLDDAVLRDPPERNYAAEEVTMQLDAVFEGKGLTISG